MLAAVATIHHLKKILRRYIDPTHLGKEYTALVVKYYAKAHANIGQERPKEK